MKISYSEELLAFQPPSKLEDEPLIMPHFHIWAYAWRPLPLSEARV